MSKISIYNTTGQMIKEQIINSHNVTLDLGNYPPGIYMLQCTYLSNDVSVHKLIIQ